MFERIIFTACAVLTVGVVVLTVQVIKLAHHVMIAEELLKAYENNHD